MGFYFYTDGWWRNPKNAVTTEATIVEIRKTHRFGGSEYKNGWVLPLGGRGRERP